MPNVPAPHYLLLADANRKDEPGSWRFTLKSADGGQSIEAAAREPDTQGQRLELLSVVRGLEALDQPSRVTVVTRSRYIERGLSDGLDDWRANGWTWERYGRMVPVKNDDLWRRVERAMRFHRLDCRRLRLDAAEGAARSSPLSAAGHRLAWARSIKRSIDESLRAKRVNPLLWPNLSHPAGARTQIRFMLVSHFN